ncbi:MAG: hypothetical protein FWE41_03825 [Coriobacteriia bacterium]|nr:hypothetical protein [Coriobacteriia bacterium]MCL2750881.1 hypothetical protein [Coriobacteriia bacterium]
MLGKLLKYDFRALNRIMLPLQGGVLLAALVGSFSIRLALFSLNNRFDGFMPSSSTASLQLEGVLFTTSILLGTFLFAAVVASFWVTLFLIARHYHQSFLRDEGYLAFTLPVSAGQNLCSKVISGSTWMLINMVTVSIAFLLLLTVGFYDAGREVMTDYSSETAREMGTLPALFFLLELCVLALLFAVHAVLQVYVSLSTGAVLARTHKVLAGIGVFVLIYIIMQILMSVVVVGFGFGLEYSLSSNPDNGLFVLVQPVILPPIIILTGLVFLYYFVSRHLLATKLNLD